MTSWWNKNVENRMNDFKIWVGDSDQPSKTYCRNYIINKQYKNIIDCGCGLAADYFGFQKDKYEINYTGLDSCKYFVNLNKEKGISMIDAELESDLPISDNAYECVYCREILEHLSYYEKTISEFIRISSKEVIVVFFIEPEKEEINYWEEEDLYHNKYDKEKLEKFILSIKKVDNIFWESIDDFSERKDILDELNKTQCSLVPNEAKKTVSVKKHILHIILNL
jgi:ubiquinone/menaquinone biosynthesis C-methylase UbiE